MGFLVGMGHNDPLRYRILPVDEFCNIGATSVMQPSSSCSFRARHLPGRSSVLRSWVAQLLMRSLLCAAGRGV